MIKFWQNSSAREKTLLAIAAGLVGIFFLWQFIYKPLVSWPKAQEAALKQAELDLKIMQKGRLLLQSRPGGGDKPAVTRLAAADFQTTITRLAKQQGLVISRRQPAGDNELTLWLETAKATAFYAWVDDLTGKYNISLTRVQLNRNDDTSIRAQVTFVLETT